MLVPLKDTQANGILSSIAVSVFAFVTFASVILAVVTAVSASFAVVTAPSSILYLDILFVCLFDIALHHNLLEALLVLQLSVHW